MRRLVWFLCFVCGLLPARAEEGAPRLTQVTFKGEIYQTYTVDPRHADMRLYLKDDQGRFLSDFKSLDAYVTARGGHLLFAANAGMFMTDCRPVGLLVQNGVTTAPLNLRDASGNFYLKPNAVFLINEKGEARVIDSATYPDLKTPAKWATQSGPALVLNDQIHPGFNPNSQNLKIRSGVGVRKDGTVVFALSDRSVIFYDFALLFRDELHCPNALFLDGDVSAFYVPGLPMTTPYQFGPMFGVTGKAAN